MTDTDTLDLDATRARADAAREEPWTHHEARFDSGRIREHYVIAGDRIIAADLSTANAEFIAHARQDVPALLALVDRLTAERDAQAAALEHTRIDRDEARAEAERLRRVNDAAMRIEFATIRALIDSLGLDPTTAEGCVPGCAEIEPGTEHYVWHLTRDRQTLAKLRDRADQEIADAKQGEWFAGETNDGRMLAREQQRRGIWETVRSILDAPANPAETPEPVTPDR